MMTMTTTTVMMMMIEETTVKNDDFKPLSISLNTRPGFRFSLIRGRVTG